MKRSTLETIALVLLVVAGLTLTALAVTAVGWYRAVRAPVELARLGPDERLRLVAELVEKSPGIYSNTWYRPAIGYTLRRRSDLEAWDDRFTTNELGYRTGPGAKTPGTYRVLFVGDSWTFGMGVSREESYPEVLAEIANHAGAKPRVEAWTLALPGYNTLNQLAALWYFYDRLQPDAVVIAPSSNDHHSSGRVLPNGSLGANLSDHDDFGHEHSHVYRVRPHDSYRFRQRWLACFRALRETEQRLQARGVPLTFYFLARWYEDLAHELMRLGELESPYLVVPIELTLGEWVNPGLDHGNPAANRIYAEGLYRGLAPRLGWPELPAAAEEPAITFFPAVPPTRPRTAIGRLRYINRKFLAPDWRPGTTHERQVVGPMSTPTGAMGRADTILINRRENSRALRLTVARIEGLPSLYPLDLTVHIPTAKGGTRVETTLPADGPPEHSFEIEIPAEVLPGAALDVVIVAARVATAPDSPLPRSLEVRAIDQLD